MSALAAATVIPALIALTVIAALRRSRWAARLTDRPNERSLHVEPTPRIGGLGVAAGALPFAAWSAGSSPGLAAIFASAGALLVVSLADDLHPLPIGVRLPAHACAAVVAILAAATPQMPWP